jgi:hypothetical protein
MLCAVCWRLSKPNPRCPVPDPVPDKLTDEEAKAIKSLERLARRWPRSLTLFSAAGSLVVIATDTPARSLADTRMTEADVLATIDGIPNDGGDPW